MPGLATTNVLLGIMAVVSVLEALAVGGSCLAVFLAYRKVSAMMRGIQERQVAPAGARVDAILDDIRHVTLSARSSADRLGWFVRWCTRLMPKSGAR